MKEKMNMCEKLEITILKTLINKEIVKCKKHILKTSKVVVHGVLKRS